MAVDISSLLFRGHTGQPLIDRRKYLYLLPQPARQCCKIKNIAAHAKKEGCFSVQMLASDDWAVGISGAAGQ